MGINTKKKWNIYLSIFIGLLFNGCKENATGNNETDNELYQTEEVALEKKVLQWRTKIKPGLHESVDCRHTGIIHGGWKCNQHALQV